MYKAELNPPQKKAVEKTRGRLLILAGAGSGKTKVIVHRIAHLIEKGIDPKNILGLTFTNKAAKEMRERLEQLIRSQAKEVRLCTFHSLCMQILRKEIERLGFTKQFSLYDEKDMQRLIQQIAKEMLGHEKELPSLGPTKLSLTQAENLGVFSESVTWHDSFSKDLYFRLKSSLRAYNAVSFDSLITLAIQLFEEHPDILEKYQNAFQYIMIDEYQDTNPTQFRLAELLSKKYQNLCVVGDDDQSIYGWRGAEVKNILEFQADETIKLEQNYRSSESILKAANAVIQNNKNRHVKTLWCQAKESEPIEIFHAPSEADEANAIVQRILRFKNEGFYWKDIAVLYRSNALSYQLETALLRASYQNAEGKWMQGIPYEVFGGLEFSQRAEIKDLLCYLRVIANPLDQEALLRIINTPRRGISDLYLDQLTKKNRSENRALWELLKTEEKKQAKAFVDLIEEAALRFQNPPFHESLLWLIEKINYKKAIEEEVKSEKMREFKWENVQEFVSALAETQEETLQDFISNTTLNQQNMQKTKKASENKVHLMTFHSSKGLEFPICFLSGLEDGIVPHEKSMMQTGIEEERRLFYVGITRAKKKLIFSMARTRLKMGKLSPTKPSRFLFEIPKELLQMSEAKIFV